MSERLIYDFRLKLALYLKLESNLLEKLQNPIMFAINGFDI